MENTHVVTSVQNLQDSACSLYNNIVEGGEDSASSIITYLNDAITNLKNNWKGADAGVQINNVITVHNAMVAVSNALAELALESSKVAVQYRDIQRANGASLDAFTTLTIDTKTTLDSHTDNQDTININPEVLVGKEKIASALKSIDNFKNNVVSKYTEIMENWTAGGNRSVAEQAFTDFTSNVETYKQNLSDADTSIGTALSNYNIA